MLIALETAGEKKIQWNWIVLCFPFSLGQSAHMPMIDALMMAYTVEMISIEKVVASVKRFSTFSASKELPFDLEDAMVFWINKVWTQHRCNKRNIAAYIWKPFTTEFSRFIP